MKKYKLRYLAFLLALILGITAFGSLLVSATESTAPESTEAEETEEEETEEEDEVAPLDMEALMPEETVLPTYGNIAIIGDTDICDAEFAALFGAKFTKYSYKELTEKEAFAPSETPEAVFFFTTREDTVTEEEGKKPVYLMSMKARSYVKLVRDVVSAETPIGWVTFANYTKRDSGAMQYSYLQSAEDAMEDPYFATSYSYFMEDADAEARKDTAERTVGPLIGDGLFVRPEEENYNDINYYVFEDGNDKANGKTPATAMKTVYSLFKKIIAERGNNMASFGENDRIIVNVRGNVIQATSQAIFGISAKNAPRTAEGKNIPVVCQTYQYDKALDNRAKIITTYTPHDAGSSRTSVSFDLTLKDVEYASEPKTSGSSYACNRFWITAVNVTFDNCTFSNSIHSPWILAASNNCWDDVYAVEEGVQITHTLTFKSGVYDESTGVDYVVGMNSANLWRDAAKGGNILEAKNQFSIINIEKGAQVAKVYGACNKVPYKGVAIYVKPGGRVGAIGYTGDLGSSMDIPTSVAIFINGEIYGEVHGLGVNAGLLGEAAYRIKNAKLACTPFRSDYTNNGFLGTTDSMMYGNASLEMENSMFVELCGLNTPSGIYFCGDGVDDEGDTYTVDLKGNMIAMVPNEKLTSNYASLSFTGPGASMYADYSVNVASGYFDMAEMEDEAFSFGAAEDEGSLFSMNVTLGEEGKKYGPAFVGRDVYVGGYPGVIGRSVTADAEPTLEEKVKMNLKIYDAVFTNDVYMNPVKPEDDEDAMAVLNGSSEIEILGGSFEGKTYLANGDVYGNINANLTGGTFADLYDGSLKEGTNCLGKITVNRKGANVILLNGKKPSDFMKYLIPGAAGVVVLGGLIALIAGLSKKKKKEKQA